MDWIKTILPLVGVIIGWVLAESGKFFADKRQDKRKLKKLLFFTLELRYRFTKELSLELDFENYLSILKNKLSEKLGIDKNSPELDLEIHSFKPQLKQIVLEIKSQHDHFEYLSENIDKILVELSEIFPFLAYELNGQHNLKERLTKIDNYLNSVKNIAGEMPSHIKEWFNPKLTKDLIKDLDESIEKIALKINKQTLKTAKEKIEKMVFNDKQETNALVDEYLENALKGMTVIGI